jgi:hypothetical protein
VLIFCAPSSQQPCFFRHPDVSASIVYSYFFSSLTFNRFIHYYQPSITLHTDAYLEALRAAAPRFVHGPYSFALPSHVSQHSAAPRTPVVPHDTSTSTGRLRTGTVRLLGGAPASATASVTAPAASDIEQQQVRGSHSAVRTFNIDTT